MGRRALLSDEERGRIKGLREAGEGIRAIARRVKRSTDTVRRVLGGDVGGERQRMGPEPLMSERAVRLLVHKDVMGDFSAAQLKHEMRLDASVSTIQRVLVNVDWFVYSKIENTLPLTKDDKAVQKQWAWKMLLRKDLSALWERIVFSDEKKWNLDGLDGFQHYWRDLHQPVRQTKRRQGGGGSVMVWGGFSAAGKAKLAVLLERWNSDNYVHTLSEFLLPFAHLHYGLDFVFQQDGASIHTSHRTQDFFDEQGIHVLDWVARSPDLNPIENLWSIMSRCVYANGRQFSSVFSLTEAILEAWESIEHATLRTLIDSMPRQCAEVIKKQGNKTHY